MMYRGFNIFRNGDFYTIPALQGAAFTLKDAKRMIDREWDK